MASDDSEYCHLCGSRENLSFEHIPPRRCFNDAPTSVIEMMGLSLAHTHSLPFPPQRNYRKGMGRRSLCERCNGFTGDRYGDAFFAWTCQAMRYAEKVESDNLIGLPFAIKPLNVLKQLATMAIAASHVSPKPFHRYLRRFIRVPFEQHAPHELAFHVYLNPPNPRSRAYANTSDRRPLPLTRMVSTMATLDTSGGTNLMVFAEIAFPPLGYLIIFRESGALPAQVKDMPDISYFGQYHYNQPVVVTLRLPVRIPVGPAPGHYMHRSDG
jgi:hypothetical protein